MDGEPLGFPKDIALGKEVVDPSTDKIVEENYGLVSYRTNKVGLRLNHKGEVEPDGVLPEDMTITSLRYGLPNYETVKVRTHEGVIIPLEDTARINEIGTLAEELLADFTAYHTVEDIAKSVALMRERIQRRSRRKISPALVEQIGVLEEVLKSARDENLPAQIVEKAQKLKDMGVNEVEETQAHETSRVDHLIEDFSPKETA